MKLCAASPFLPSVFAAATLAMLGSCSAAGGRVANRVRDSNGDNNNYSNNNVGTNSGNTWNGGNNGCGTSGQPVCVQSNGNRFDYNNACLARNDGYSSWSTGRCSTSSMCSTVVQPVCVLNNGNRIEFSNSCKAENAGYFNYSNGRCSSTFNEGNNNGNNNGNNCNNLSIRVCGDTTRKTYCSGVEAQRDNNNNWTRGACSNNNRSYSVRGASGTYTFERDEGEDEEHEDEQAPETYTCSDDDEQSAKNPCNEDQVESGQFYFAHPDDAKFVQCDESGGCFEKECYPGTVWDQHAYTCVV